MLVSVNFLIEMIKSYIMDGVEVTCSHLHLHKKFIVERERFLSHAKVGLKC